MNQLNLFNSNYSENSRMAYRDNVPEKQNQASLILQTVRRLKETTLKQISQVTGLPQSTAAGRVNDLIKKSLIRYHGVCHYENRLRKKIIAR